jgi:hypothetical protein
MIRGLLAPLGRRKRLSESPQGLKDKPVGVAAFAATPFFVAAGPREVRSASFQAQRRSSLMRHSERSEEAPRNWQRPFAALRMTRSFSDKV